MFDTSEIVIGIIGIVSTVASGFTSWFFTKRKYNAEVDNNLIDNMQQSLEFYINLVEDNKRRLEEVLERNNELERRDAILEEEVRKLQQQLSSIMDNVCFDKTCHNRKESITNSKNGTKSKKKV